LFAGSFAPEGWALCDGSTLPISQYDALFTLIGTTYGGDGQTKFGLPDFRGRVPVHVGSGLTVGQPGGSETATLDANTMAPHSHMAVASPSPAGSPNPGGQLPATISGGGATSIYGKTPPFHPLDPSSVVIAGGSQPHPNIQPYVCLTFIIALNGIYPNQ
jgi:microcystin-dependent protein